MPQNQQPLTDAANAPLSDAGAEKLHSAALSANAVDILPDTGLAAIEALLADRAYYKAQAERLQAFKDYVHGRLDAKGIDRHDEQNALNGCRIGARLDDVLGVVYPLCVEALMTLRVVDEHGKPNDIRSLAQRAVDVIAALKARVEAAEKRLQSAYVEYGKLTQALAKDDDDADGEGMEASLRLFVLLHPDQLPATPSPAPESAYPNPATSPYPDRRPWGFCETPGSKCTMGYCDENGCLDRKRPAATGSDVACKPTPSPAH